MPTYHGEGYVHNDPDHFFRTQVPSQFIHFVLNCDLTHYTDEIVDVCILASDQSQH